MEELAVWITIFGLVLCAATIVVAIFMIWAIKDES